jgi:serine/tyrosine/threonine adenylyltransferase
MPLLSTDANRSLELAQAEIDGFDALYTSAFNDRMRSKLAFQSVEPGDEELIADLFEIMANAHTDFTTFFRALAEGTEEKSQDLLLGASGRALDWLERWRLRGGREHLPSSARYALMKATNPSLVPRNHRVESAVTSAEGGDYQGIRDLLKAVTQPFSNIHSFDRTPDHERVTKTFCGT